MATASGDGLLLAIREGPSEACREQGVDAAAPPLRICLALKGEHELIEPIARLADEGEFAPKPGGHPAAMPKALPPRRPGRRRGSTLPEGATRPRIDPLAAVEAPQAARRDRAWAEALEGTRL